MTDSRPRLLVRAILALGAVALASPPAHGQIYDPVQWRLELEAAEAPPGGTVLGRLTATIQEGWHIYSSTTPEGIALDLQVAPSDALASWEAYQPTPEVVFDPNFQANVEWYTDRAEFLVELVLAPEASGEQVVQARVRYGACDDRQCLPPARKSASASLVINPEAASAAEDVPATYQPVRRNAPPLTSSTPLDVAAAAREVPTEYQPDERGAVGYAFLALGFGFLAIFTPCVFPMIPIYMSSFMASEQAPWGAVLKQAGVFCLGVIVLFTALGGVLSAAIGPFGLSTIGSSAWVNLFIAAVLCVFASSMLGAFEISVPSSWTTRASERSVGAGFVPMLMLSLVFTLASFACTGPFIGALLAGSLATGDQSLPLVSMAMFSVGLSTPFFVLALFPALMNGLPKSGAWLAVTKRTAGFVILAVSLKYFGNVDQVFQWGFLTRERFLALWIVLFAAAALYLWGLLRLGEDGRDQGIGLVRFGAGAAMLALAVSLVPGMFGGRLGELDAHVPEASRGAPGAGASSDLAWIKDDYDGAVARARAEGKPLLVSFTGYACSNCKWMKANMFTRPEIMQTLRSKVLVELYTDGFDELSERHQAIQVQQYRSSSIPFYALLRPDGSVAGTFSGQTRDARVFRDFLDSAS